MSVTVAGLAGTEGSLLWTGTAVSQGALLTVLALIALRTGTLLYPAGRSAGAPSCRHQGDIIEVTGT